MAREGILYGFHAAEEALKHQSERINHVWTSSDPPARVRKIINEARKRRLPVQLVDSRALTRLAGSPHHQDIVIEVGPYRYYSQDQLLENVSDNSLFCILDEIQDVTNFATLIRSAEGAGVQGIFVPERRTALVTSVTSKLSAGALEHVRIARAGNLARLIEKMQQNGIRVICADASAAKLWYDADYSGPLAILVGNEHHGVRKLLKEKSDDLVRVPMIGKIQSLNVNVAAAILLYEAIRQRQRMI